MAGPVSHLDGRMLHRHKLRNILHSVLLIGGMALLAAACTWFLFGVEGILWATVGVVLGLGFGPVNRPARLLTFYGAQPLGWDDFPPGMAVLDELTRRAALPRRPLLCYVPTPALNAFAVGRPEDSAICVTDGLLRILNLRELAGVLAHEVSHIRNNDLWTMSLADTIGQFTALLSYVGQLMLLLSLPFMVADSQLVPWPVLLLLILAPAIGTLLQLGLSRSREFDADLDAADLTGDPAALASALRKLERYQGGHWEERMAGRRIPQFKLLRTHPSTDERVRRLLSLYQPRRPILTVPHDMASPAPVPPSLVDRPWRRWHLWP